MKLNGRAIELYKRPVLSTAAIVNRARDEFLASTRLAQQEHRRIAGRHHFDELKHFPEGLTVPHNSITSCIGTDLFV